MKLFALIDILKSSPYNPNADVYIYDLEKGNRIPLFDTDIDFDVCDETIDINVDINRNNNLYGY